MSARQRALGCGTRSEPCRRSEAQLSLLPSVPSTGSVSKLTPSPAAPAALFCSFWCLSQLVQGWAGGVMPAARVGLARAAGSEEGRGWLWSLGFCLPPPSCHGKGWARSRGAGCASGCQAQQGGLLKSSWEHGTALCGITHCCGGQGEPCGRSRGQQERASCQGCLGSTSLSCPCQLLPPVQCSLVLPVGFSLCSFPVSQRGVGGTSWHLAGSAHRGCSNQSCNLCLLSALQGV